jgi:pimeloyl-ACP methyl ester carboxylesterase
MKPDESLFLTVRGLRYHVRVWGRAGAPKIFMLHGWLDVSASFQFVVDALRGDWQVFAPDWRGYGLTQWAGADSYWYPDYFGDLDCLLAHFQPHEPVNLVGHSLGGNVACIYSGVRPARIARLINLEGLGMRDSDPREAPKRYARWLDELAERAEFREFASFEDLASQLRKRNPRLTADRAEFLARHLGRMRDDGRVSLRSDPAHKRVNPVLYREQEVMACMRCITAPVLWVQGAQTELTTRLKLMNADLASRKQCIRKLSEAVIPEAGHMVHHDQPARLAETIEKFMAT